MTAVFTVRPQLAQLAAQSQLTKRNEMNNARYHSNSEALVPRYADRKSRRRWFRFAFGLRTLFVLVTIACVVSGWLVWQIRIVKERKAVLAEFQGARYFVADSLEAWEAAGIPLQRDYEFARVSYIRRLLGDESFFSLNFPSDTDPKLLRRAEIAFPESLLSVDLRWPGRHKGFRDSLSKPVAERQKNYGNYFHTGLIEKSQ